jgi:leucyl-tRNA synthetase
LKAFIECGHILILDRSLYKEAQKVGFYELLGARDWYRDFTAEEGGMHADLLRYYVRVQALLIAPIAPHFAEHVWGTILGEPGSIQNAAFPNPSQGVDDAMIDAAEYVKETVRNVRTTELNLAKRKAKATKGPTTAGPQLSFDPAKPKRVRIFVADKFPAWQGQCIDALAKNLDRETALVDEKALRADLEKLGLFKDKRTSTYSASKKKKRGGESRKLTIFFSLGDSFFVFVSSAVYHDDEGQDQGERAVGAGKGADI